MPLSEGYKAISAAWAVNTTKGPDATDDRIDPDDPSLTTPIVIADGFPDSFSALNGDTIPRKVQNELWLRRDSGLLDIRNFGVLPWDTDVDTLDGGIKQVNGVLYKALADNGPTYTNAVSPTASGQTVWERVVGTLSEPDAPNAPTAAASNGVLDWTWNCPLDGGAEIDHFSLEWRQQGGSWSSPIDVDSPRYTLTGLTNGQVYQVRVLANNPQGDSGYSPIGSGTPVAAVPSGGAQLALRGTGQDAEVELDWLEPDNNGANITGYTVQWRSGNQQFGTGRQQSAVGTSATIVALSNGTEYTFRVQATNSAGAGAWSNTATATPVADTPAPPADTAPNAPGGLAGAPRRPLIVDWTWNLPTDNGGQRVESFDLQWRYGGQTWAQGTSVTGLSGTYRRITVADATRSVQARVRAGNSVSNSGWASTATVAASALLEARTLRHTFESSQTFTWPYANIGSGIVTVRGGGGGQGGSGGGGGQGGNGGDHNADTSGTGGTRGLGGSGRVAGANGVSGSDGGRDQGSTFAGWGGGGGGGPVVAAVGTTVI